MTKLPLKSKNNTYKSINVAIAVIYYQDSYLLGFRHSDQHQGNLYEFVGGKIDSEETAQSALIREVNEEVGIDLSLNNMIELGRITHDYGDKQVCLHTYQVELTATQYHHHKLIEHGLEGQALTWVSKSKLLSAAYPLPAANTEILTWL